MKSSTLRRSNLSRQRMKVIEQLYTAENGNANLNIHTEEYVRPAKDKEKELDVLWQNFRVNQKEDKSPGIYLITGFIAGAIAMLILTSLIHFVVNGNQAQNFATEDKQTYEKAKLTFIPADKREDSSSLGSNLNSGEIPETYTVKSGDTLAGIIIRFYGTYDVSKIEKIKKANHMRNADSISIGQKLVIPMD